MRVRRLLKRLLDRLSRMLEPGGAAASGMNASIARLRDRGVRIGEGCVIYTDFFSTEPYLVTLGDRVAISGGTKFITHDGSVWLLRAERPACQSFGPITVGNDVYIGENCIVMPNSSIGSGCILGAGAVVRGKIPDNSLVIGNPAKVVGQASLFLELLREGKNTIDTLTLDLEERRRLLLRHFGISP
jgi:acetyltransferase-like isoleucine patch superfamily enzyme